VPGWYRCVVRGLPIAWALALGACSSDEVGPRGASGAGTAGAVLGAGSGGTGGNAGTAAGAGGSSAGGSASANGGVSGQAGASGASGAGRGGQAASGSAGMTSGGAPASAGAGGGQGADALEALRAYLTIAREARPALAGESFATVPLTQAEASTARQLLWDDHATFIRESRQEETDAKAITIDDMTLRYDFTIFGAKPATGRSLFISLHGGGNAAPSVNDEQWENQKVLYEPDEGVYLAPRAPTDTWNLWHEAHIDGLFYRLIEDLIVFEDVDPNHVYVMGYSAGGDGVYQIGPRMADSWAAASMMAGHPNDALPDSLRNIGFAIHVGAEDADYERNQKAADWGVLLDELAAADPDGYAHEVELHAGKGHWMDLEDAAAVPWMAAFTRDPAPKHVVWLQDDVPHERFYWLAVPEDQAVTAARVVATASGQTISVDAAGIDDLKVRLSDALVDLDQPVTISQGATTLFTGTVPRTILVLATTLAERGDPAQSYDAEVVVAVE
jgi:hypothetical protein